MASILVCGGSVIGLSAAMMLARDGHAVTVLEADGAEPPPSPTVAWDGWRRTGVAQFRQPHNLFPRFRRILDEELPGTVDRLAEAGCVWTNPLETLPPFIEDREPRPDDDKFRFVTGRRPVVEWVLARAADAHEGVDVRRGVAVGGLLTGDAVRDGVPHVCGVHTVEGEDLRADLVVDASGRRTKLKEWLLAVGAREPHTESEDSGFVYNTRFFRGPDLPEAKGPPLVPMGSFSLLTLPGDNGTWSVTLFTASDDRALRAFRDTDRFAKVVGACPFQAHWLDGEPITDVLVMAGVLDRYRRFVVDDRPVATGVAAVGDAWACTNPSAGRGLSVGLLHAQRLRHVVRDGLDDTEGFVRAWDRVTEADVAPFFRNQIAADRVRLGQMRAIRDGTPEPPADPTVAAIGAAMLHDPDVFRGVIETVTCLALPQEVFARAGFMEKVEAVRDRPTFAMPGPDREEVLRLLA